MVQINYCDICGKEIGSPDYDVRFYQDDSQREIYMLCRYHDTQVEKFLKMLKKTEKKKERAVKKT